MWQPPLPPRRAGPLLPLLCLVLVAACNAVDERQVTYATWKQADPPPQPQVERIPVSHAVAFAPLSQNLTDLEREALVSFLRQIGVRAGERIVLTVTPPEANQPDQSAARLAALRAELARLGLATRTMFGALPGLSGDQILVTAETLAVTAPDCPGYNTPIVFDQEHRPILNFGCANAANLGLMVANPADLLEGRPLAPADGEAASLAIQRYRAGTVWPANQSQDSVPFRQSTQ